MPTRLYTPEMCGPRLSCIPTTHHSAWHRRGPCIWGNKGMKRWVFNLRTTKELRSCGTQKRSLSVLSARQNHLRKIFKKKVLGLDSVYKVLIQLAWVGPWYYHCFYKHPRRLYCAAKQLTVALEQWFSNLSIRITWRACQNAGFLIPLGAEISISNKLPPQAPAAAVGAVLGEPLLRSTVGKSVQRVLG